MLISIITVNLNNAGGLQKTMASVFAQTYPQIEYIIIDGGSDDGSTAVLQQHTPGHSYDWISEADSGVYQAMNKGIAKATGDFLLFLNSGDFLADKDVIKNSVSLMLANPAHKSWNSIFYGKIIAGNKIIAVPVKVDLELFSFSSLPHPASFISRQLFEKYGPYKEDYKIISDWVFFIEVYLKQAVFIYIDLVVTIFELNGMSANSAKIEGEKKHFLENCYPNLAADFRKFQELRTFKLSRVHRSIEKIRKGFGK